VSFSDRLDFLLDLFDANMSKLARAIKVDPSLVSKWRSGARRIPADSIHMAAIAEYFAKSGLLPLKIERLTAELQRTVPIGPLTTSRSLQMALIRYLSDDAPHDQRTPYPASASNGLAGSVGTYEVFYGVHGRRAAVLKLLRAVLVAPSPLELLLFSQEEMSWLTGDKAFLAEWAELLIGIVSKGHRLKIIHHVNRESEKIVSVIEHWMPVHLSGRTESYFLQKYSIPIVKSTLFVVRGTIAVMAAAPGQKGEASHTFYCVDPVVVRLAEEIFDSVLSSSLGLFHVFDKASAIDYLEREREIQGQPGDCLCLSAAPSTLTMPLLLYEKLVSGMEIPSIEKETRINHHRKISDDFQRHLLSNRHADRHTEIEVADISTGGVPPYESLYLFQDSLYRASVEDYVLHLENLIALMRANSNFEYIVLDKKLLPKPLKVHMCLKYGTGLVLLSDKSSGFPPVAISFDEPTVLKAFEDFLLSMVDRVPLVIRDKERNIRILEERVSRLKKAAHLTST